MKALLAPLSWLYGLAIAIRHSLYEHHLLPSHRVKTATICVGNLAVGGTGKTPHVEYLLRMLSTQYKVAVLSRGYKRKTRGFVLADEHASATTIGDEAMQIHRKFPDIAVAVCEKRVRGVKELKRRIPDLQVVILDDAFQHSAIRCGYYILLTPYNQLYIHDHLLPWGRLRDLKSMALKANSVIVTQCPPEMQPIDFRVISNQLRLPPYQSLFFSRLQYKVTPQTEEAFRNKKARMLVVTGIAQPDYLMAYVRQRKPDAQLLAFSDHHRFSKRDIAKIEKCATNFDYVLTTEKDYQRLAETTLVTTLGTRLLTLPIEVQLCTDQSNFSQDIHNYITQNL